MHILTTRQEIHFLDSLHSVLQLKLIGKHIHLLLTMPRISQRKRAIEETDSLLGTRMEMSMERFAAGEDDELEDIIDETILFRLQELHTNRYYMPRGRYRKNRISDFLTIIRPDNIPALDCDGSIDDNNEREWLSDEEFLNEFRVSRSSFWILSDMIRDNPVFSSGRLSGRKQAPCELQLLVLLRFLGIQGTGASNPKLWNFFTLDVVPFNFTVTEQW